MPSTDPVSSITKCHRLIVSYTDPLRLPQSGLCLWYFMDQFSLLLLAFPWHPFYVINKATMFYCQPRRRGGCQGFRLWALDWRGVSVEGCQGGTSAWGSGSGAWCKIKVIIILVTKKQVPEGAVQVDLNKNRTANKIILVKIAKSKLS